MRGCYYEKTYAMRERERAGERGRERERERGRDRERERGSKRERERPIPVLPEPCLQT